MDRTSCSAAISTLDHSERELRSLRCGSETEIAKVGAEFEELARLTDSILHLAVEVIGGIETDTVRSILPNVQSLGGAARKFIEDKLEEAARILDTVKAESTLLGRLSQLTHEQRSIARETNTLGVLTKIEVARLGQVGRGFEYLAHQLDDFSQSVVANTAELAQHTDERRTAIDETMRGLGAELPRVRVEFAQLEGELDTVLSETGSRLQSFFEAPAALRNCVEGLASQISGVVAAIQSHDITRQQVEHVQEAMRLIAEKIQQDDGSDRNAANGRSWVAGGLVIQSYQLKSIQQTVGAWVSQIRRCMDGIMSISSAELKGIGPMVLQQQRQLSQQLLQIEALERKCESDAAKIEEALTGLSALTQLVGEHLKRSRLVRDRLQLLTFNSIIEASSLGAKADGILEISQSIKRISASWGELTDRSEKANEEILTLVEDSRAQMRTGSENDLRTAQTGIEAGLEGLARAAALTAGQAPEIDRFIGRLQAKIVEVGAAGDRLDTCFARIGAVLNELEQLRRQYESEAPAALAGSIKQNIEAVFSASYTTESEREILRAALLGAPLPAAQQNLAGNDVELF